MLSGDYGDEGPPAETLNTMGTERSMRVTEEDELYMTEEQTQRQAETSG